MVISHKHRFIYFPPHRTGSTSILDLLRQYYEADIHLAFQEQSKHDCYLPYDYEDYFTFATIRNPYTRFVSFWSFMGGNYAFERMLEQCPPMFSQIFARPMSKIHEEAVPVRLDRAIRFENLQEAFDALPFVVEKRPLPTLNSVPHTTLLTKEQLEAVRNRYAIDFQKFGYDPEIIPKEVEL